LRTIATPVVVVMCALALGAIAWHLFVVPISDPLYGLFNNGIDTRVYRGGGLAVLNGTPLYDGPVYQVWQFTYAPFAAIVMAPLGLISEHQAIRLMNGVNVVCLLVLVFLTLRALGFRRDGRFWLTTVATAVAASLLESVRTTFWNSQINLVLAVLIVGCLTLPLGRWRGIGAGLSAGIKLTPIFFVCYLAVTRQWRAAVVMTATFATTVVLGLVVLRGQAWKFWTVDIHDTTRIGPLDWPANQSFNGFFVRLGTMGLWHPPSWLWVPVGTVVALIALYTVWRAQRAGATMQAITVTGMTSCAVSPFAWGHLWVWFVPLLLISVVQAADATRRDRPATWLWWLAPAGALVFSFGWRVWTLLDVRGPWAWRFGSFRLFWAVDAHGWGAVAAVICSGAYLVAFLVTLAVTLWWAVRHDRMPFKANAVSEPEAVR
jgi:alpha-1,2-mannosyltransferase